MNAYRILIHDSRETGPVVLDAELARDARAYDVARERLAASPYFTDVELWRGEVKLCHLKRCERAAA